MDGPEQLTVDDITHSLVEIIVDAQPDTLLTGMPREAVDLARGDHSDHSTTASFARAAWRSMEYDPNVSGDELERKVAAFATYSRHDPVTVNLHASCERMLGAGSQRDALSERRSGGLRGRSTRAGRDDVAPHLAGECVAEMREAPGEGEVDAVFRDLKSGLAPVTWGRLTRTREAHVNRLTSEVSSPTHLERRGMRERHDPTRR